MFRCWRCNAPEGEHKDWCEMEGGCTHCGWAPHRWWCLGPDREYHFGVLGGRNVVAWEYGRMRGLTERTTRV